MIRSNDLEHAVAPPHRLAVIVTITFALFSAVVLSACGSNGKRPPDPARTVSSHKPVSKNLLPAADAERLADALRMVDAYCRERARHAREIDAALGVIASLDKAHPKATMDGRTVDAAAVAARDRLKACGAMLKARQLEALRH